MPFCWFCHGVAHFAVKAVTETCMYLVEFKIDHSRNVDRILISVIQNSTRFYRETEVTVIELELYDAVLHTSISPHWIRRQEVWKNIVFTLQNFPLHFH